VSGPSALSKPTVISSSNIGAHEFIWGERTYVMGVVNVTPDSFSGDGVLSVIGDVQFAIDQALRMEDEGADIIDIGGESTRPASIYPDAQPVSDDDEISRVIPVIDGLISRLNIPISIDTRKASVARVAVRSGAALINDVSMLEDPQMVRVISDMGVPIILSHIRKNGHKDDVVNEVIDDLRVAANDLKKAKVSQSKIIIDPGIGFAKNADQSIALLRNIHRLRAEFELPVLIGTSRKSFIGSVTNESVEDRRFGTAATVAWAVIAGVDIVRVHDVLEMVKVVKMTDTLARYFESGASHA
jgi:dihydropteroate synthase|tara:strand:- start:5613 stop:6512 length:900 start_codon:yes stop_codon:yes gene_type:complete